MSDFDDDDSGTCSFSDSSCSESIPYYTKNISKESITREDKYDQWEIELYQSTLYKLTKHIETTLDKNNIQLKCTFDELYQTLKKITTK